MVFYLGPVVNLAPITPPKDLSITRLSCEHIRSIFIENVPSLNQAWSWLMTRLLDCCTLVDRPERNSGANRKFAQ